jgi:hypothetical protein
MLSTGDPQTPSFSGFARSVHRISSFFLSLLLVASA